MYDQNNAIYKSFLNQKVNTLRELSRQFPEGWFSLRSFRAMGCHGWDQGGRGACENVETVAILAHLPFKLSYRGKPQARDIAMASCQHCECTARVIVNNSVAAVVLSLLLLGRKYALYMCASHQLLLNKQELFL